MSQDQFKGLQTMDDETRRELLKDEVDILTPAVEQERKFLEGVPCPKCGVRPCLAQVDAKKPFAGGLLPRRIMKCLNCRLEFEPYTGIQVNMGELPSDQEQIGKMFVNIDEH